MLFKKNQTNLRKFNTYQFLLKSMIYLLFIGQLGTNIIPHCHWLIDAESAYAELCNFEHCESEEEKDNKIKIDLSTLRYSSSVSLVNIPHLQDFLYTHHLEVMTPPPEYFFS